MSMKDTTSNRKLTSQQLADHMGVSTRTIGNWKATGVIPFIRIGRVVRFDLAEVEAGLDKFKIRVFAKGGKEIR